MYLGMGWLFLLPYFMLILYFPSYVCSLCNHHDTAALLQLKNSFTLNTSLDDSLQWFLCPSYTSKTESWKKGTDCCNWDGVTCHTMSGHVIGLDLSCSNLQGQFHANGTIFRLTHLQKLNLAYNDFSGSSIHSGIGHLVNLTHLNLANTGMSGDIPSTISHLSKLVSLDLSNSMMPFDDDDDFRLMRMRLDSFTWKKLILNTTNLRELILDGVDMSSIRESALSLPMNLSSSLVTLSLRQTDLKGNFPSGILCLPNLQELNLVFNQNLGGELPKSNWSTSLRYLDLSLTAFSGQIPNSLGHLKSLDHLSLLDCQFDGLIPSSLFNLTQLSYLDLSYNNLVGPIPSKNTKLLKLQFLSLDHNKLNGTIPRWCYYLPSLSKLSLSNNRLTGTISEFSTYSLRLLDLSNNKLQGYFPKSIFEFKDLFLLDVSSNNLRGFVDFHQFCKFKNLMFLHLSNNSFLTVNINNSVDCILPNLEYLDLSYCNIKNFPKFLAQVQNLIQLDLSKNKIQGKIPKWFHEKLLHSWEIIDLDLGFNQLQGDLPIPPYSTQYFSVTNNGLTGDISSTMCNASSLGILNLAHNNLTGKIPQCLGTLPSLSVLDFHMNNLYGNILQNFSKGNVLETIKLNHNQLEGPLPLSLAHCTYLEVLDLGDNNIEDVFPSWLETLQHLQVLSLRSNLLRGVISCCTTKHPFPNLRIFDVSNNKFSGPLPASYIKNFQGMMNVDYSQTSLNYMLSDSLYNDSVVVTVKGQSMELVRILTTFTTLDLSNNMFEGEIPEVIGALNSLKGLNLSHNGITGTIPQSLSNLRNLEWLDLSWNHLTGEIPMALTNLNFLSILNLSQNQFEGIIPTGRQFDTFENNSYEGNPMLCGTPLSKSCNKDEKLPPHSTFHHEESGFGWKAIAVGYGCGMVFGMLLGYSVILTGKPQWLAKLGEGVLNEKGKRRNNRGHANNRRMN